MQPWRQRSARRRRHAGYERTALRPSENCAVFTDWNIPRSEAPGHWPCTRAVPASLSQVQPSSVRGGHSGQQARWERSALCPSNAWGVSPENADPQNPNVRASISLACAAISLHPRCAVLASEARLQPRGSCSWERRLPPTEQGPFQCKFLNRHAHNASLTPNSSAHNVSPTHSACARPSRDALRLGVTRAGGAGKREDFFLFFFFFFFFPLPSEPPSACARGRCRLTSLVFSGVSYFFIFFSINYSPFHGCTDGDDLWGSLNASLIPA